MSPITLTLDQQDAFEQTLAKLRAWHEAVMLMLPNGIDDTTGFGLDLFFEEIDADFRAFLPDD